MTKHDLSIHHFQRKISDFCEVRIAPIASQRVLESIRPYLVGLVIHRRPPPIVSGRIDWTAIGEACGIENQLTADLKKALRPGLDAIVRWLGEPPAADDIQSTKTRTKSRNTVRRKVETATRSRPRQILSEKTRLPLRQCRGEHNRNQSVQSLSHCLRRPMIRRALTMRSFITCAGSARATGNSTAPSFAWARRSMTRLCCRGFRASACRDL